ncbi:MAG TPA: hypothetical protein VJ848_10615 [Candidatus Angelobacter sp.]|nr:hypothetical protein [Candidatus Angelobacter sp.]
MSIHTGTFSVSVSGFTNNPNGTLSIGMVGPDYIFSFQPTGSNTWIPCTQNPPNPGQDISFSVTVPNNGTYNFSGAYTGAQGPNPAKYHGNVNNDGHPNPRATPGTWQAQQTNPLPRPAEDKLYEVHKKAV